MELQFQKKVHSCLKPILQETKQTELTQELRLGDGMPDVGRVLGTWGLPVVRSKQWSGDQVTVSGGVMVWVLYAPEDGTECRSVDLWIPFQMRWDIPACDRDGVIRVLPLVRFADSRTLSSRKMMVRVGLALHGQALCPMDFEVAEPDCVTEGVELLKRTYPLRLPKGAGEKIFTMDEEFTLPEHMAAPAKILRYLATPEITEKKILGDKILFRGNLNLQLLYRDGEGNIRSWTGPLVFSQYEEVDFPMDGDIHVEMDMLVTGLELDLMDNRLHLKCNLAAQYLVNELMRLELIEDAYGVNRDVTIQEEMLRLPVILDQRTDSMNAEQMIHGKRGEILDAVFLPDFPRRRRNGSDSEMELCGMFYLLSRGEDGAIQGSSVRWEGAKAMAACEECAIDAKFLSMGSVQTMESGEGMALSVPLQMETSTGINQELNMITGLDLGALREGEASRPSLILCKSGKENLWAIAKRCGSTVGAIRSANKLDEEPPEDRFLLIPVS